MKTIKNYQFKRTLALRGMGIFSEFLFAGGSNMKKVLVIILVSLSTGIFALNPVNYKAVYKLNTENTFNGLIQYLDANDIQADQLKYLFELTENKLRSALKTNDDSKINKVLIFNIGNAKYILSDKQYRKYLAVLNLSVNTDNVNFLTQKK